MNRIFAISLLLTTLLAASATAVPVNSPCWISTQLIDTSISQQTVLGQTESDTTIDTTDNDNMLIEQRGDSLFIWNLQDSVTAVYEGTTADFEGNLFDSTALKHFWSSLAEGIQSSLAPGGSAATMKVETKSNEELFTFQFNKKSPALLNMKIVLDVNIAVKSDFLSMQMGFCTKSLHGYTMKPYSGPLPPESWPQKIKRTTASGLSKDIADAMAQSRLGGWNDDAEASLESDDQSENEEYREE